jgi:PAS domain S-box-containing protein
MEKAMNDAKKAAKNAVDTVEKSAKGEIVKGRPIGSFARPDIPEEIVARWQNIVDLIAMLIGVPVGLIMRVHSSEIEVFASSATEGNPYEKGERAALNTGLYCETVMARRAQLLVPDARKDSEWAENPDVELGMVSYLGLPLLWPDGQVFGTLCVLDRKENAYSRTYQELMRRIRDVVEMDLWLIGEVAGSARETERLRRHRKRLVDVVRERTAGLKAANEELRREAAEREQAQERVKHLNAVLRAIRNVNQLIIREKDRDRLLQGACANLIETRGFRSAWIALLGEGEKPVASIEAGVGEDFAALHERLARGVLPECCRGALGEPGIAVIRDPSTVCPGCPLAGKYRDASVIAVRLEHEKKTFGVLVVALPKGLVENDEEISLLLEVAGDVAFALHGMETQEKRRRANESWRRAEKALGKERDSAQRYLDIAGALIVAIDADQRVTLINKTGCRILGYDKEEIIGKNWFDTFLPEGMRARGKAAFARLVAGALEPVEYFESPVRTRSGGERLLLWHISVLRDEESRIMGTLSSGTDITEHKQVEEERKKSEMQYRTLINHLHAGVIVHAPDTRILLSNEKASELLGLSADEMAGRAAVDPAWCFTCEDETRMPVEEYPVNRVISTRNPLKNLVLGINRPRTDDCIWVLVNAFPELDDRGELRQVVVTFIDITERKRAELALQESEKRYRLLAENAADLIWTSDLNLRFRYVSPSVKRIRGYTPAEMKVQGLEDILTPASMELAMAVVAEELARENEGGADPERSRTLELEQIRKDGSTVWTETTVSFLRDRDGSPTGLLGVTRDITERKQAEAEKEKIRSQLLQAQKMEAIGALAGGVAHDFNNQLTAIQGYTDLILMDIGERDPRFKDLKQIRYAAERAGKLTRQLLLFSRKQPMELASLDVNRTIEDMLKMLNRLIGEDVVIETEPKPGLWTIQADEGKIEQVIMNLIVNARDAMPTGGRITIKTENVTVDEEYCRSYSYARSGRFVCLSVEDTGVGMEWEVVEHIFEPFFTTKEAGRGTGLGLSVVYGIVKQHEGWINVYSEPDRGTVFRIYLAATTAAPDEKIEDRMVWSGLRGAGERILLVEDEQGVREFAVRALRANGYEVVEAVSAAEATEIFEREGGKFHLLFSDVVLGDQSGLDLVERFLKRRPELGVLLSSGYMDEKSQWPVIRERGYSFLNKPYFLSDLLKAVKEALALRPEVETG